MEAKQEKRRERKRKGEEHRTEDWEKGGSYKNVVIVKTKMFFPR